MLTYGCPLFYGGGSVIGEARPEQSAVHLRREDAWEWVLGSHGSVFFTNGLCRGTRITISDQRPTLARDPSCRLILSSAILP